MHHKIFTALPDFLSNTAKEVLFESVINEHTGLVSWPRVVQYEHDNGFGEIVRSHNPPTIRTQDNETRYYIRVYNLEAHEYLCKTGWMYDPKHTGVKTVIIDNRRAPGA